MANLLQAVIEHREAILLGEIGAFLHMFGKASSEFLVANSLEGGTKDSHQDLKHLPALKPHLENPILQNRFTFDWNGRQETLVGSFTDFITKYKKNEQKKDKAPDCILLWLFNSCHRMTSADEKGVVRKKQPKGDMKIATPFGHEALRIDLNSLDIKRAELDQQLATAFQSYLLTQSGIESLREQVVCILKAGLSQALGETRQPANDVTLWAQSYGVASLYKPVLATLAMGLEPSPRKQHGSELDYDNIRWRLFGIGWNGLDFIERGRKPGDILKRQEILDDIGTEIQKLLEDTHPVGNRFYGDLNGLFFTFPGVADTEAARLVEQLAPALVQIVRGRSADELWPFFTLSKPRRTFTAITKEIAERDRIATAPKVAASIFMEQGSNGRCEKLLVSGPTLTALEAGQDICPICRVRSKPTGDEACWTCWDRRSGRREIWQKNRVGRTIWIDEVADQHNRVALLTVRFDLSQWLSGEWLTTLLSQTFADWISCDRTKAVLNNQQQGRKLKSLVSSIAPTPEAIITILGHVGTGQVTSDAGFKAVVLSSFFEDVQASQNQNDPYYIVRFLENLRGRINDESTHKLTSEDLSSAIFTQNPSPARLARIWEETETFLDLWLAEIKDKTFIIRPQRLAFTTESRIPEVREGQTYRIVVPNLAPGPLTILCLNESQQDFLTVDSLEKFQFEHDKSLLRGLSAAQCALEEMGIESWEDEATGKQLTGTASLTTVQENSFRTEPYLPFIVLARSPVYYQVLFPASWTPDVLRRLLALANERFRLVEGKLPLHVGLLAAKRKFPLYALIEAGQQMLDDASFQKKVSQVPWWDTVTHATDPFYGQYPRVTPNDGSYKLSDLASVNAGQEFVLTPGYFDFDFLGSTSDRHLLAYEVAEDDRPSRPSIAYGHLHPRPFPLHRLRILVNVWDLLVTHLGPTQCHHLEEALTTKLMEWEISGRGAHAVFSSFANALLRRSFGDRWKKLDVEQRNLLEQTVQDGLLLEALELYQHILKEKASNE